MRSSDPALSPPHLTPIEHATALAFALPRPGPRRWGARGERGHARGNPGGAEGAQAPRRRTEPFPGARPTQRYICVLDNPDVTFLHNVHTHPKNIFRFPYVGVLQTERHTLIFHSKLILYNYVLKTKKLIFLEDKKLVSLLLLSTEIASVGLSVAAVEYSN